MITKGRIFKALLLAGILLAIADACKTNNKTVSQSKRKQGNTEQAFVPNFSAGPPVMVYKTRSDYADKVPVVLSPDKSRIVSYPDPADVRNNPIPTPLIMGYLLDNRGIDPNIAYLNISYTEYAKLKNVPTMEEMNNMMMDKDPLTELCNCGNRQAFKDVKAQVNDLITQGKLRGVCKVVK